MPTSYMLWDSYGQSIGEVQTKRDVDALRKVFEVDEVRSFGTSQAMWDLLLTPAEIIQDCPDNRIRKAPGRKCPGPADRPTWMKSGRHG